MTRWGLVLLLALLLARGPAGAEPWRASLEVGGEVDSNVRRVETGAAGREAAPLARAQAELVRRDARRGWRSVARGLLGIESRHPREPHLYLAVVGVRPERQGQGLGSALLGPGLALSLVIPSQNGSKNTAGGPAWVHPPVPATGSA